MGRRGRVIILEGGRPGSGDSPPSHAILDDKLRTRRDCRSRSHRRWGARWLCAPRRQWRLL